MIRLFAPYPAFNTLLILPNAEWGDVERLEGTMILHRSMDSQTIVTHVNRRENIRILEFSVAMTRMKSLEYLEFFIIHSASKIKLEADASLKGDAISLIGYLRVNPADLEIVRRAVTCDNFDEVETRFDFETVQ